MTESEVISALYALAAANDVPADCTLATHASGTESEHRWTVSGWLPNGKFETASGKTIAEAVADWRRLAPNFAERIAQLRAEADRLERELSKH